MVTRPRVHSTLTSATKQTTTVVAKKMVHRKNETAPNKRPTEHSADISATTLLCRIAFALLSGAPPPSHAPPLLP